MRHSPTEACIGRTFLPVLLLLCLLGFSSTGMAQAPLLVQQTEADAADENTAVLDDPSGSYGFEQALDLFAKSTPKELKSRDCVKICWYRITLRNPLEKAVVVEPDFFPDIALFDTWVVRADHSVERLVQGGNAAPTGEPDMAPHPSFALKQGEEAVLYLRLVQRTMFNYSPRPVLEIKSVIAFLESRRPIEIVQGMLLGALIGLAIYNMLIAVSTRDRSYRWYCAYLLMMALSSGSNNGRVFISLLYPQPHPLMGRVVGHFADAAMWLCLIMFIRNFLETPTRLGKWDRLFWLPATLLVVGFLFGLVPGAWWWIDISYIGFVSPAPVGVVASLIVLRQGFRPAIFVLVSQLIMCFGAGWQTAHDYGWVSYGTDSRHPFLWILGEQTLWVLTLVEALIFSLALADRIKSLQQEMNLRVIQNLRDREVLINKQRIDLEHQVAVRTGDLVEEKSRSDRLLQNILPHEIAKELMASGTTQPKRYDNVSVLFTDFRGFTTVVSSLPADRLVQELNEIFRSFDDILDDVGVEKIKTIGDSYMIVAGVPADCGDHAARCAEAALRMLEFIEERNKTASIKWEMRAGIHSGSVVAGIVGKRKFAYDIFGDTVNIASRMESAGLPGRLNVSAYTYDLIRHQFASEYRGKVNAKGKGDVDMYFISRIRIGAEVGD